MNSFNHYAYGSVADWLYEEAAGIQPIKPGFAEIRIEPKPDPRLGWLSASIETRQGLVSSKWVWQSEGVQYEITTPSPAKIIIGGKKHEVCPGSYTFWETKEEQHA